MFRTELPLVPSPQQLPLSARILTIGSCFSDTIGHRLASAKVHTLVNPFGTIFNPLSACKLLRASAGEDVDWQQHLVEARGRWQSYDLHATLGADSPVDLLQLIQQLLRDTGVFLATADVVVLTLGTAWAYRLNETDELVSNCHKVPAEKFSKELLTPDEIINTVAETHAYLRQRNPKLRFVLTVSPVRHVKDTLPLNAVSKSVLRVACHYLSELLPDVSYFPAYELLLDDLRDYRFYAADMLHPSTVAEDYIWERFARTYFNADFGRFRKEWEAVQQALNHRPLHVAAPEHRQFLTGTLERLEKLAGQADMRMEILDVRKRLQDLPAPKPLPVPTVDDEERIDVGEEETVEATATFADETLTMPTAVAATSEQQVAASEAVSEAELLAEGMAETAQPKKKRRNRGGAKRNKKKHAARLAEEAAALATDTVVLPEIEATLTLQEVTPTDTDTPAVTVQLGADMPLQTALERRKRASRRGRGGKDKIPTELIPATTDTPDDELLPAPELAVTVTTEEPTATLTEDTIEPAASAPVADQAVAEPALPSQLQGPQRPARTGRSASEVRAAALRKPRRPDSRIKTLYATTPTEAPAGLPTDSAHEEQGTPSLAPAPEPVRELPAVAAANATPAPAVIAVPLTRGTGASGRLSAAGKATLATGQAQPRPDLLSTGSVTTAPIPPQASIAPAADTEVAPVPAIALAPEAPEPPAAEPEMVAPTVTAETPPVAKPARKPATKRPTAAKPKSTSKPKTAKAAPEPKQEEKSTDPAVPTAPAKPRRKPAAKPKAATTPAPPEEAPKRATRPSRRKPAPPEETVDPS